MTYNIPLESNIVQLTSHYANFVLSDYILLISIITLSLFLGILKILKVYKTQVYVSLIIALIGFLALKDFESLYYNSADNAFLLMVGKFIGMLLLGYALLLQQEEKQQELRFEYPTLIIIALFGILLTLDNSEGLLIFLGLEIQAFTFYTMVSLGEKHIFSAEGALKYFLLGAIASGIFILGVGVIYSVIGKTNFLEIAEIMDTQNSLLMLGGLLVLIGLLFKIGAVPFHLWLPDAYEGAPFYVLLFLISVPKIALFYLLFTLNNVFEHNTLIIISLILSAIVGSIQAVEQTKIKRFVAYTIIYNNTFFLSLILLSGKGAFYGLMEALMLYIIISLTTVLAFFLLKNWETKLNLLTLRDLLGLKKTNIYLGMAIIIGFFSAAGIPPFMGFFQKYIVLLALVDKLQVFVLVTLIMTSILPAYYYIRMSKIIYFIKNTRFLFLANISKLGATLVALCTALSLMIFY